MVVRELVTKLGFQVDQNGIKRAENGIASLKNGLKVLATALAALGIGKLFTQAADSFEELVKASQRTGIATDALQRLGYAAELADLDLGTLQNSLGFLARNFVKAKDGSDDTAEAFQRLLGKDLNRKDLENTETLFLRIADATSKMANGQEKNAVLAKIFGKSYQQILPLLNEGADQIRKSGEELEAFGGILGVDALNAGNEFNDGLKRMRRFFIALRDTVAARFFPAINELIDRFVEFLKTNKEIIGSGLDLFFKQIELLFGSIGKLISLIIRGFEKIGEMTGITGKHLLAFSGAFFAIIDDIQAYIDGRPSFFKPVYDKIAVTINQIRGLWQRLMSFIDDLVLVFNTDLMPIIQRVGDSLNSAFQLAIGPIKNVWNALTQVYDVVKFIVDALVEMISKLDIVQKAGSFLGKGVDLVKKGAGFVGDKAKEGAVNLIPGVQGYKAITERASDIRNNAQTIVPMKQMPGANTQNNDIKVNSPITVNVTTDADANEIAKTVEKVASNMYDRKMRDTLLDLQPGEVGVA